MVMNDASNLFVATVVLSKHVPNNFAQCNSKIFLYVKWEQKSENIGQTNSALSQIRHHLKDSEIDKLRN